MTPDKGSLRKGKDMANPVRNKILLSVDGSEHALHAVRYTADTVPAEGVEIVLFHVMTKSSRVFLGRAERTGIPLPVC